jgi:hydrogenase nickel incorporation protein HypA/HybF
LICLQEFSFRESVNISSMHEIRIAKDLSEIVLKVAAMNNLSRVTKVNISFGQMIQIIPDIFDFVFREAVRDTIAFDAVVDIEILPVKMRCKNCKNEFNINDNIYLCRRCASLELDIMQGKELFIKSIEGE